eukprot:1923559-Amphidinium_carterae.2
MQCKGISTKTEVRTDIKSTTCFETVAQGSSSDLFEGLAEPGGALNGRHGFGGAGQRVSEERRADEELRI